MMRVVAMRVGAAWRQRTGSLVAVALLIAVAGGTVLTATAGARRTRSTEARFLRADGTPDVGVALSDFGAPEHIELVRRQPQVASVAVAAIMTVLPYQRGQQLYMPMLAPYDDGFASTTWRGLLIAGRRVNPAAADEVMLSEAHARLLHAHVGAELPLVAFNVAQAQLCLRGDGGPSCNRIGTTPAFSVRIVGIVRTDMDVTSRTRDIGFSILSHGFFVRHHNQVAWSPFVMVKLRAGVSTPSFIESTRSVLGDVQADVLSFSDSAQTDSLNVLATGLLLFAIVAAIAAAFAIGQVVVRQVARSDSDRTALAALGLTRAGRSFDAAGAVAVAALAGALLAVLIAFLASTLMPIGIARRIEPHRGRDFDATVLVAGAVGIVAFVVAAAVSFSVLARRRSSRRAASPALVARIAGTPAWPSANVGLRNALGGGRDSVPDRSATVGITAAVAGVVAVLMFGASLHHLVQSPVAYGWGWDVMDIRKSDAYLARLLADPDVGAVAVLERRGQVRVGGNPTLALAVRPVRGTMGPTLVRGRGPERAGEAALGRDTLIAAHRDVGGSVVVQGPGGTVSLRVVGVASFPTADDGDPIADGVFVVPSDRERLVGGFAHPTDAAGQENYAVRFRPGVDRAAAEQRLARLVPAVDEGHDPFTLPTPPAEVDKLRQVQSLPNILGVFLAALGLLAVAHALFVGVRRRGRDFAVLRALGFRPRDVRRSVAWEAVALAVVGASVGIPIGLLLGRFAWSRVARDIGVPLTYQLPVVALAAALPLAIVIALAVAFVPGRRAGRLHPAVILRAE